VAGLKAVLEDYDFSKYSRIIDVGGAMGSTLAGVLRQQPHASGVLFDLPQVCTC
jgi:O-methyltransferase domain